MHQDGRVRLLGTECTEYLLHPRGEQKLPVFLEKSSRRSNALVHVRIDLSLETETTEQGRSCFSSLRIGTLVRATTSSPLSRIQGVTDKLRFRSTRSCFRGRLISKWCVHDRPKRAQNGADREAGLHQ